jgi:hypothetical protein
MPSFVVPFDKLRYYHFMNPNKTDLLHTRGRSLVDYWIGGSLDRQMVGARLGDPHVIYLNWNVAK